MKIFAGSFRQLAHDYSDGCGPTVFSSIVRYDSSCLKGTFCSYVSDAEEVNEVPTSVDKLVSKSPHMLMFFQNDSGYGLLICISGVHKRFKRTQIPCRSVAFNAGNSFPFVSVWSFVPSVAIHLDSNG